MNLSAFQLIHEWSIRKIKVSIYIQILNMGSSQAQNVQRGIVFMWFIFFILLTIMVVFKLVKKQLDPIEEDQGARKDDYKESQENISTNFDKIATKKTELKEDASYIERFLYGLQDVSYFFAPFMISLPLNIITGTSKSFCFTIYFIIGASIFLFNQCKLHRKCSEHKCVSAIFQNLWLLLTLSFFVNQWGASTILMPYAVVTV